MVMTTDQTPLAEYMGDEAENFLDLAKRLELSLEETIELRDILKLKEQSF